MTINLSNIRFSYPEQSNSLLLDIPSWSLSAGEHTLIYGSSGSGKSTLLNIFNGLLSVNSGHVKVLGQHLNKMTSRQRDNFRANNIGYIFQQFNLIPYLNAVDNIQLASCFSKSKSKSSLNEEIKALLKTLNLPEKDWNKPVRSLSIGQQQRIAIARALINKPTLLIADEPTSALDQENRESFMALLMSIVKESNITLLFVSHDMSLSRYFTRVESLNDINKIECVHAN
jgi:putative ABC transport system ATP-binding protein